MILCSDDGIWVRSYYLDADQVAVLQAEASRRVLSSASFVPGGDPRTPDKVPADAIWLNQPEGLVAYATRRRWEVEVAGTTWGGFPVATDDRSKVLVAGELTAIALAVRQDGEPFKFADNVPRPLSNADMQAVAIAMRAHVKATFGALFGILSGIQDGSVTTRDAVDAALAKVA